MWPGIIAILILGNIFLIGEIRRDIKKQKEMLEQYEMLEKLETSAPYRQKDVHGPIKNVISRQANKPLAILVGLNVSLLAIGSLVETNSLVDECLSQVNYNKTYDTYQEYKDFSDCYNNFKGDLWPEDWTRE